MSAALLPVLFAALMDAAVKGTVILLAALLATRQMRRRPAASRHLVWMVALASLLALPLASRLLPAWRVVPVPGPLRPAASFVAEPSAYAPVDAPAPSVAAPSGGVGGSGAPVSAAPSRASSPSRASAGSPATPETAFDWKTALLVAWAVGGAALALRLGYGLARVWWMQRRAIEIDDEEWVRITDRLARRLRVGRLVTLLRESHAVVPMTWGIVRPVVLLPSDAEEWDTERRTVVLAHELAHVRRWDTLTQWIAHLALALFWFHPLVWVAARRMREEREHACDDAVLSIGTRPVAYADHLLSIVRSLGQAEGPAAALAMARRSQFEGRLLAILDSATQRGGVTRGLGFAALVVAAAAVLPLATLGAARTDIRPGATHASLTPPAQASDVVQALRGPKPAEAKPEAAKGVLGRIAGQLGALVDRAGDALPGGQMPAPAPRDTAPHVPAPPPAALPAAPASAASAASGAAGASPARPAPVVETKVQSAGPRLSDAGEALLGRLRQGGDYADVIRAASSIAGNPERAAVLTAVLRRPDLGPDDLALALRVTGAMTGNPEKRDVLKLAAERYSLTPMAVRTAFFGAVATFTGDPERRDVLQAVVARQGGSTEVARAVILSLRAMPGEAERRDVLTHVLERADVSAASMLDAVKATNEIPGVAVRRDVLQTVLAHRGLSGEVLVAVLHAVASIPSSAEQRDVLTRAAATQRIEGAARDAYITAAYSIAGSSERADALSALVGEGAAERTSRAPARATTARAQTGDERSPLWSSDVSLSLDDGRVLHVEARKVIRGRGADEIEAIRPGGSLVASEVSDGRVRRVEMLPCRDCAGGISRRYTVDGRTQPYDAAAQRWLAGVLHTFLP